MRKQLLIQYFYEGLTMMDRSMIDAASGGALMDKTPAARRHLISNMARNTQQFGIRGADPSQMVNEVDAIDNLRLENQLIKLASLVRQLVIGQHQPSIAARVCGICTSMVHPIDMCPTLQETESDHLEIVGSIVNNLEGNNTSRIRFKDNIQLKNSDPPKLSTVSEIPSLIVPTTTTTKSAITRKLTIFRGPNKAVGDKQPGVLAYYELQQYAIPAKFECHNPRSQNTGGSVCEHCESATVNWVWEPSLTDNSKSKGECECHVFEEW
ncbi:hypothetical protein CR513_17497, partial [Mucuna pruriens]